MIWITIITILSIILAVLFVKGISKVRSKLREAECDGSVLDTVMDYPKICASILVLFVLFGWYQVKYQMKEMYNCSVRSSVQKVETQYSWYFDVCQFKNKDGVWIDFKQVRGTPEGGDVETE